MPKMTVKVPHQIGQEEARTRIQRLLADVKDRYAGQISDVEERWSDNRGEFSLRAMGFNVSGTLEVRPDEVELNGDLPFAAMPFKGRIETTIRERAEQLLA